MTNIQQKLKVSKYRIRREKFLSASDPKFSDFLARAEYSIEVSCTRNTVFAKFNNNINVDTASNEQGMNWNNFTFKSWQELIAVLERFQQVKNYIGWFFINRDGPYFKISLNAFLSHVPSISDYGIQHEHYFYGWAGEVNNVGIIIGKNPIMSGNKEFYVSLWGL